MGDGNVESVADKKTLYVEAIKTYGWLFTKLPFQR